MGPGDIWECGQACLDGTPLNWGDALAGLLVIGMFLYALLKDTRFMRGLRQWWEERRK